MAQKYEIKGDRAQLWLNGYTRSILEGVMFTGDFKFFRLRNYEEEFEEADSNRASDCIDFHWLLFF